MMNNTRILGLAAATLVVAACNPFRSPFKQAPVTEVSAADPNAHSRWHGTLTSPASLAGAVQINGAAAMVPGSKRGTTRVTMNVSNATPGGVHPWQLHYGQCGADEGVFGPANSYRSIKIDDAGRASAAVTVAQEMPATGNYHVSVGASAANSSTIVACGNLAAPTR